MRHTRHCTISGTRYPPPSVMRSAFVLFDPLHTLWQLQYPRINVKVWTVLTAVTQIAHRPLPAAHIQKAHRIRCHSCNHLPAPRRRHIVLLFKKVHLQQSPNEAPNHTDCGLLVVTDCFLQRHQQLPEQHISIKTVGGHQRLQMLHKEYVDQQQEQHRHESTALQRHVWCANLPDFQFGNAWVLTRDQHV